MFARALGAALLAAAALAIPAGSVPHPDSLWQADTLSSVRGYVQSWLDENGYQGFKVFKITAFAAGDYVAVAEPSGKPAFELEFVPMLRTIKPEPVSRFWNTRYGTSKGLGFPDASATSLAPFDAKILAGKWLALRAPRESTAPGGRGFPGYYTFDTMLDQKPAGMISVNATTGALWYHSWYGAFIDARTFLST
jgi:hypothetical protein